jgi:uncharacterized protein (DUF58 family)
MNLLTKDLLAQIEQLQIPSRRRLRQQHRGERAGLKKGSSLEFSDYREYLPGDDIRNVDWNVYARTERLFLKLFLEEQSKPVYFVVDASESMNFGEPTKFEYALALAGALSYVSLLNYDQPRMLLVQEASFQMIRISSISDFFPAMRRLEQKKPGGQTKWSSAIRKIVLSNLPKGIFFLMSDFYSADGWDGMKLLAAAGNELHCLHILTDEEIDPSLRGDLRLIDAETKSEADVSISAVVLKSYRTRLKQMQESLKNTAFHSASTVYNVRTSTPLKDLLLYDLRKTGIVT